MNNKEYYLVLALADAVLFLFLIIESSPKYAPRVNSAAVYGFTFVLLTPSHSLISVGHLIKWISNNNKLQNNNNKFQ